jgi:3-deoxy-D-manno-octulosonic-acid transferase
VGNLKYDSRLPADFDDRVTALRNRLGPERPIWVAGSTHHGEEAQLLDAHRQVLQRQPGALLVIAPRHPERARDLAPLCRQRGLTFQYLSRMSAGIGNSGVLIVDSFGDLVYLYGLATAAFVGGSLIERGGHNPLEALMAATPVISGPSVDNFQVVYQGLVDAGAVRIVSTEAALADQLGTWFGDQVGRNNAAEAGLRVIQENRGALQRCLDIIDAELAALESADS